VGVSLRTAIDTEWIAATWFVTSVDCGDLLKSFDAVNVDERIAAPP